MNHLASSRRTIWLGVGLIAVIVASWLAFSFGRDVAAQPRAVAARNALLPAEQAVVDLFERSRPSVVHITTQARVLNLATRNTFNVPRGSGSGFVWDDRGHIVTNNHVIAGPYEARVQLADGRQVVAKRVGASPDHDLAVLRIELPKPPAPLPIGRSSDLKVGQTTYAIGNPFGLDWTLTTGIVSALDRSLPSEDQRTEIEHLIQTDAAINPGNSGGPLLDSAGRLIGVNTAIFSPSGASAGVGFAVPVDTVNRVVPQLISTGRYTRPELGVRIDEGVNQLVTRQMGVSGVVILQVTPGSGAAAAGLRGSQVGRDGSIVPGDIIVAVEGTAVDSVARLIGRLDERKVGDAVRLTVLRDGKRMDVKVVLQAGTQ